MMKQRPRTRTERRLLIAGTAALWIAGWLALRTLDAVLVGYGLWALAVALTVTIWLLLVRRASRSGRALPPAPRKPGGSGR